jgi:hypothetical protein
MKYIPRGLPTVSMVRTKGDVGSATRRDEDLGFRVEGVVI